MKTRFKIDFYHGSYPFALYWREPGLLGGSWRLLDTFETKEKAKDHYEKVKDLPEYLS